MSTRRLAALAGVACWMLAALARAHPLGNASTNHFVGIRVAVDEVAIRYVVDMAEIAAFQEIVAATDGAAASLGGADREAYLRRVSARYIDGLTLAVDDVRVPLRLVDASIETPVGVGGQSTLRVTVDVAGPIRLLRERSRFAFEDTNHPGRAGWHEIVVEAGPGVAIFDSTAFAEGASDALRRYPNDSISAPLDERAAQWWAVDGPPPPGVRPQPLRGDMRPPVITASARLRSTFTPPALSTAGACWSVLLAFALGGLQALASRNAPDSTEAPRTSIAAALVARLRAAVIEMSALIPLALVTLVTATYLMPPEWRDVAASLAGGLLSVLGIGLLAARARRTAGAGALTGRTPRSPSSTTLLVLLGGVAVHDVGFGALLLAAFAGGLLMAPTDDRCRTHIAVQRAGVAHACIVILAGLTICAGRLRT